MTSSAGGVLPCPFCATLLDDETTANECPACGKALHRGRIRKILEYAGHYYHFGWQCRRHFEAQADDDQPVEVTAPPAGATAAEALLAMAVLSGVLGNAPLETVGKAVDRLAGQLDARGLPCARPDDQEIAQLVAYFRSYKGGLKDAPESIRKAVWDEELLRVMKRNFAAAKPAATDGKVQLRELMAQAGKQMLAFRKQQPSSVEFLGFWSKLG